MTKKLLKLIKKLGFYLNKVFLNILLTPLYFLAFGLAKLLKKKERGPKDSFWKGSEDIDNLDFKSTY